MSADSPDPPPAALPDGPGRDALDWVYRYVAAVELTPTVAVHSQDAGGLVRFWNNTCAELYGIPAREALGRPFPQLVSHLGEQHAFDGAIAAIWRTGKPAMPRDWQVGLRDGSRRWLHSSHFPVMRDGLVQQVFCMEFDISERKRAEDQARHQARHDALTGLPDRTLFLDRLQHALAVARRRHSQFALMFLDLDRFKAINDTHGHQAGDAVLTEVAARLRGCVRGVDTVSRIGGDEFVVLLADIGGVDQAAHVAGAVMQAVDRPVQAAAQELALSVSIGIAIGPDDGADADTLMRHADVAMYHAKQSGRNAFRFFSPGMNAHVVERAEMENRLRQALANGEFVLEYQPEVDIASGRTTGVEALIRWRHPERGLLAPHEFIPVAEESGLIVPIGEWVLREACRQARAWRDEGYPVVVAVNLSGVQFIHDNLVGCVDAALAGSGLEPRYLDLEVTEAVIMNGDEATIATVGALRERGVQLTIDDFGTGFSSLSSLRRVPLSKLKIDRSFIDDITRAPADAAIIPAIIAVARSLKLRVIAEGVENAEQLRFLQQHGCDEYQGWYASIASSTPDLKPRRP